MSSSLESRDPAPGVRRIVRIMDLADDTAIGAYDHAHSIGETPPEVIAAQARHGIVEMQIYRMGTRLIMLMDVSSEFDPDGLYTVGQENAVLADWHRRMAALQRAPFGDGVAWPIATRVFCQSDHIRKEVTA